MPTLTALGNFRSPGDIFVGRHRELAALGASLQPGRPMTLTGPGGVGKTRLAVEYAATARCRFPDGVRLVDLASVAPAGDIEGAVAEAVGTRDMSVLDHLSGQELLLILDTCEHVGDSCADFVERLMCASPSICVLATSREPLQIPGEVVREVPALSATEAARLFEARTGRMDDDPAAVTEICDRLDRFPLAVELAACRAQLLSAREILHQLASGPDFLHTVSRGVPRRHHSLRACFEWSYELLSPPAQVVLRRLATFACEFDLAGATAVAAAADVPELQVLDLLAELEAKALICAVPAAHGKRFRLHRVTQCYANEELRRAGEREQTLDRLKTWLATVCAALRDRVVVTGPELHEVVREETTLREVVENDLAPADPRYSVLVTGFARCLHEAGHIDQARGFLDGVADELEPGDAAGQPVFLHAAWLALLAGDLERAGSLAGQAGPGEHAASVRCLIRGDWSGADELCRELAAGGMYWEAAMVKQGIAWTALQRGDLERAAALLDDALPMVRTHADHRALSTALYTAGALALETGDLERAEASFTESLHDDDLPADRVAYHLEGLAVVAARRGRPERAVRLHAGVAAVRSAGACPAMPGWQARVDDVLSSARAALPSPRQTATEGAQLTSDQLVQYALTDDWAASTTSSPLSARKSEIVELVAQGLTNRQIARRLHITERTVAQHVREIRDCLGLESRVAVAVWLAGGRSHRRVPPR